MKKLTNLSTATLEKAKVLSKKQMYDIAGGGVRLDSYQCYVHGEFVGFYTTDDLDKLLSQLSSLYGEEASCMSTTN